MAPDLDGDRGAENVQPHGGMNLAAGGDFSSLPGLVDRCLPYPTGLRRTGPLTLKTLRSLE
jgi:hypothetical protein